MTHGDITIEIKSDTLSEAISIRDFLVTFNQVLLPERFRLSGTEGPSAPLRGCLPSYQNVLLLQPFLIGPLASAVGGAGG